MLTALIVTQTRPRDREEARPLGLNWSCNPDLSGNLDYDTIKSFKDNGLRLFLVGYESGNDETLTRIKKGVTTDEMRSALTRPPSALSHPMGEGHATKPAW